MRLLLSVALFAMSGCSTAPRMVAVPMSPTAAAEAPSTYTVTGTATIEAIPDVAELVVVLSSEQSQPKGAAGAVKQSQAALTDALGKAGVTAKDIAVSRLTLSPVHELIDPRGAKMRLRGYEASVTITVTTRDFESLPDLMDLAAGAGATNLSSRFRVEDRPALRQRAREEAAKMARTKAERMADVLGVSLGRVRAISEGDLVNVYDNANFNSNRNDFQPAPDDGDVHGEAEDITMTVNVTYELAG